MMGEMLKTLNAEWSDAETLASASPLPPTSPPIAASTASAPIAAAATLHDNIFPCCAHPHHRPTPSVDVRRSSLLPASPPSHPLHCPPIFRLPQRSLLCRMNWGELGFDGGRGYRGPLVQRKSWVELFSNSIEKVPADCALHYHLFELVVTVML